MANLHCEKYISEMNLFCNIIKLVLLNWQCWFRSQVNLFHVYRQNAFQVVAVDGICSGIIQCLSAEDCMDWLQAIAITISNLTKHNVSIFFRGLSYFPHIFDPNSHKCLTDQVPNFMCINSA